MHSSILQPARNFSFSLTRKMNIQMLSVLILLVLVLHIFPANSGPLAPALFVFGDSLLENGNNNFLPTIAKANYPPYGMNFDKGPTGRFTNGRTAADFIAEYLGLPYSPPYYSLLRGTLLQPDQKLTGLNYASAASGILPETGTHYGKGLNLGDQIDLFERTVKEEIPRYYKNSEEASNYLSKSVFMFATGNNDFDFTKQLSPQPFADLLIQNLSQHFQRLYGLGARKVIMFEIGPLGCIPYSIRSFEHNGTLCVDEINEFAIIFNDKLASMLQNLTSTLTGSSFVLGRINGLSYDAIINPSKYGFMDTSNPCCVAWLNGTSACIPQLWAETCKQPEKYFFFDGYHLTEPVYKIISTLCFNGSSVCIPNIQHLVSQD